MSNRIDELRGSVSYQKLAELINVAEGINTNASTISKLAKGEMQLTQKWIMRLAKALDVEPSALLGTPKTEKISGFQEDAVPHLPADNSPLRGLMGVNRELWKVRSNALDELGIKPGDLILVVVSEQAVHGVQTGDPVVVQVYSDQELTSGVTLLRQFIEPDLLITNSREHNAMPLNRHKHNAHIKGRILHHIREPGF